MHFPQFVDVVQGGAELPIRFSQLRDKVHKYVPHIHKVKLFPIDFGDHGGNTAHYVLHDGPENDMREGRYEDPCFNAEIRFDQNLKDDLQWFNFVMTKELMHIFDPENARVDSRDKFAKLLGDIEARPAPGDDSPEYRAEMTAYWRALIALCPKNRRDELKVEFLAGEVSLYDVAEEFLIPEGYVSVVMGDNFERAYNVLMNG